MNNIEIKRQEFDIDQALEKQEESYKVDENEDAALKDADDNDVQDEFIAFCQEHEPFVSTIHVVEDRCSICEQKHQTLNCYLLTQENIPVLIQRRIAQAQVRLKYQIEKMLSMKKSKIKSASESDRPPYPRTPHYQKKTQQRFDKPNASTITTNQLNAFREHTDEQVSSSSYQEAYEMPVDDRKNFAELEQMILKSVDGEAIDLATPIVANIATRNQDMIVDFGEEHDNIVPIHAEFEEPLVPEDYDAYGGGHLIW